MSTRQLELLTRARNGEIARTTCDYEGAIEPKTMRRINRHFLEKAASGYFFPLDPMDAYADLWLAINRKAENLPPLAAASPHTYLCGVARLTLLGWFKRHVEPARADYRRVEDAHFGPKGACGVDDFDGDNYDPTEDAPGAAMTDATDRGEAERLHEPEDLSACTLGEELAAEGPATSRVLKARETLATICAHLDVETVLAFDAYCRADGDFRVAADLAGVAVPTFYRRWRTWIASARAAARRLGEEVRDEA